MYTFTGSARAFFRSVAARMNRASERRIGVILDIEEVMPLYEYDCKNCSKQVEILVAKSDAKPVCPECGSKKLSKLLSVIGSPVVGTGAKSNSRGVEPGDCGRSQCARGGCMFGN